MVARQRPSSESVTMVVLCGPIDTSYSIPHGMGVNHFFSPAAPRAAKTWGYVDLSRGRKPVKAFVIQCPQGQQEAVDAARGFLYSWPLLPLPEGEGKEGMPQNHLGEVLHRRGMRG